MTSRKPRLLAVLLIAVGALLLLTNAGLFGLLPQFAWTLLLLLAGGFFWLGSRGRLTLWQRIVGFAVIGVLAIITAGAFAGTVATAFPALAFALMYLATSKRWWPVIPAGVLGSVSLLITIKELFPRWNAVPVMFLGFAATFTLLYLLPRERGGQPWALYPALVWIILTVVVNDPRGRTPDWLLPLLLIGGGMVILWLWQRRGGKPG